MRAHEILGVALLGCAHIHVQDWVEVLQGHQGSEVRKVWDRDLERAERYAMQLGATSVRLPEDAYSGEDIQIVVVGSETIDHEWLVPAAASAGKHLFVEKPLGMDARSAWTLAKTISSAGVLFQTGYFLRGWPRSRLLKEMIDQGKFGELRSVRVCFSHQGALQGWFDGEYAWMTDTGRAGYGAFGDLGTHALDLILWLLGEPGEATAIATTLYSGLLPSGADERGEGMLRFENGAIGSISAGWVGPETVSIAVEGSRGSAHAVNDRLILVDDTGNSTDTTEQGSEQSFRQTPELPHPLALLLGVVADHYDPSLLVSVEEAARRNMLMDALYATALKTR